jgi:hypothetical protein
VTSIEAADRMYGLADFLLLQHSHRTSTRTDAAELVAYTHQNTGWQRRLLGVIRAEPIQPQTLELSNCGRMVLAETLSGAPQVFNLGIDTTAPSQIDIPVWLGASKQMFFSALSGHILGLFLSPQACPKAFNRYLRQMQLDPLLTAKQGAESASDVASSPYEEERTGALVTFRPGETSWTLNWATYGADYPLSAVSRDGTAIILSEFWNHCFIDFSF